MSKNAQVHIWQEEFGKPSRTGYHNQQWARKMETIGLMPSDTGNPGGKKTGQHMSDYPIKEGKFMKALQRMPKKYILPFVSTEGDYLSGVSIPIGSLEDGIVSIDIGRPPLPKRPKSKRSKTKYSCPDCGMNVWGKPDLEILCLDCEQRLEVVD